MERLHPEMKNKLALAQSYSPSISSVSNARRESAQRREWVHTHTHTQSSSFTDWNIAFFSPCVLLCWASEASSRGRRSCDWSRCWWATVSSQWRTGSRLSGPDPRKTGLWQVGRRRTRAGKKKKRTALISMRCVSHAAHRDVKTRGQKKLDPCF